MAIVTQSPFESATSVRHSPIASALLYLSIVCPLSSRIVAAPGSTRSSYVACTAKVNTVPAIADAGSVSVTAPVAPKLVCTLPDSAAVRVSAAVCASMVRS